MFKYASSSDSFKRRCEKLIFAGSLKSIVLVGIVQKLRDALNSAQAQKVLRNYKKINEETLTKLSVDNKVVNDFIRKT